MFKVMKSLRRLKTSSSKAGGSGLVSGAPY